jgi:hypothetical protein
MQDRLERFADPHRSGPLIGKAELLSRVGDRTLALEDLAHNGYVVLDAPVGSAPGLAVPALDDLGTRHADAGNEAATTRQGIDRGRRHRRIGRGASGQLHNGGAELDVLCFTGQKGERGHGVRPVGFCRPYRIVAQGLGALHHLDRDGELGA